MNHDLRARLRSVQVIPMTAFDGGGKMDLEPMRILTERLFEAGMRVFLPCAGSGEFHALAVEEIVAAVKMTREVVGDEGVILAPVGMQLHHALKIGEQSLAAGADGLLMMPFAAPYLSDTGARDYCLAVLDGLDCPTLLYKKEAIPSDALLIELAEHQNLIGVKYAMNDVDAFNRVVHDDGGRIDWYCGNAERFAPFFMLAGAPGFTTGAGNLCPRLSLAMHAALVDGDWDEALRLQQIIRPIEDFRARRDNSYNVSFLKHGLTHLGLDFGPPRPPGRRLTDEEKREIDQILPPILAAERELTEAGTIV